MYRKSTKIAAALLSAVLMLQGGAGTVGTMPNAFLAASAQEEQQSDAGTALMSETQPEPQMQTAAGETEEAQTQASEEAQTQAPTEVQTQAPTEAQTQAPTETQAVTETQTQAPTETQAATEAQTQAPTETQAATEAQTQASAEAQKESQKEKEKKNSEEKETERLERKNSGGKMTASNLKASLGDALDYLLAAKTIYASSTLLEKLGLSENTQQGEKTKGIQTAPVVQGAEAEKLLSDLGTFSVKLADASSSADVEVINLYADQDGKLDETQLKEKFSDKQIDATKKYVVVNVIADYPEQKLDFSGYEIILSGEKADYQTGTEPGDVLYNFAAMQDGSFAEYTGSLTLTERLQGTFLAPKAEVTISSRLSGAVFADTVTAAEGVTELLHIVLIDGKAGKSGSETEETGAAEETVSEPTKTIEGGTSEPTEVPEETNAETAEIPEETNAETAEVPEETDTEPLEVVNIAETEFRETETAAKMETEVFGSGAETEQTETLIVEELLNEVPENNAAEAQNAESRAAETVSMLVSLVDASDAGRHISSAVFAVKDSEGRVLENTQSSLAYEFAYTGQKTEFKINLNDLQEGTPYYLSQISTASGYLVQTEDAEFEVKNKAICFKIGEAAEKSAEITILNTPLAENTASLTVTAKAYYNEVLLTAEEASSHYVALFADAEQKHRVSAVQAVTYEPGSTESNPVVFAGLDQNLSQVETTGQSQKYQYYLAETDAYGTVLTGESGAVFTDPVWTAQIWTNDVLGNSAEFSSDDPADQKQKHARIEFYYPVSSVFPTGEFSYPASVHVTKKVFDQTGGAVSSNEQFYFNIYRTGMDSAALGEAVFDRPVAISMEGTAAASVSCQLTVTDASETFAVREVDADGNILATETGSFPYAVSYLPNTDGTFTVNCEPAFNEQNEKTTAAAPVNLTIENRKTNSLVSIQVVDASTGNLISGVPLVIKTKAGKLVLVREEKTFTSGTAAIQLENLLTAGQTYYLSALQTPGGYAPAEDLAFTVNKSGETIVSLEYKAAKTTDYKLTLSKQVYSGKNQVYAYDTTNGAYAAKGAYTFYAALFADAARTQKVSDVQKITVSALGGTTVFKNLEKDRTYYVGETDQYGQLKKSTTKLTIKYANKGVVTMSEKSRTSIIQNSYSSLPGGYRYTGTLTITKNVTNASGAASKVTETFYAGIYRTADYSDKPTTVKLELSDASSASVKKRILLSGTNDMVYYIAELDAEGNRITDSSDFTYSVQIDNPTVTVSKGSNASVTITNKTKATKATLYLTKKVYEGTSLQTSSETFYAGLFKDAQFTQPYTKPIAMKMNGKSELTLKLSLNLGTASNVKIYVAEVDADGNVIKDEKSFGYEVRLINSTVEFTQDRREVQTILLNSKYGTASNSDWNTIFSQDGNDSGSVNGGYWGVSDNGAASEAPQTADETPLMSYVLLMSAAFVVLLFGFKRSRSR